MRCDPTISNEFESLPLEAAATDRLSAPDTHSITAMRHYIPALDGVRGLAILVVMFCHFTWIVVDQSPAPDRISHLITELFKAGRYGVDLFFVLSGFLITGILLDAKSDTHYFRNFYARRTLRIFPLYYVVLFCVFFIMPMFVKWSAAEQNAVNNQAWLWLYLGNIKNSFVGPDFFQQQRLWLGHFWSLAIEEQFYLVWPTVILLLSRTATVRLCAAMIIFAPLLRVGFFQFLPYPKGLYASLYFTFCKLDTLALGALFALIARSGQGLTRYARFAPLAFALTAAALAPLVFLKFEKATALGGALESLKLTIICVFCGSVLLMAATSHGRGIAGWFFTTRFLRFLGKYSYAIYIFHELMAPLFNGKLSIQNLAPRLGGSWYAGYAAHFVLAFAISVGMALISWNLLEKHMLKLKRFFEHESREPMIADVPQAVPV